MISTCWMWKQINLNVKMWKQITWTNVTNNIGMRKLMESHIRFQQQISITLLPGGSLAEQQWHFLCHFGQTQASMWKHYSQSQLVLRQPILQCTRKRLLLSQTNTYRECPPSMEFCSDCPIVLPTNEPHVGLGEKRWMLLRCPNLFGSFAWNIQFLHDNGSLTHFCCRRWAGGSSICVHRP